MKATFSNSLNDINNKVKEKTISEFRRIIKEFNCLPLEGNIKINNNEIIADIGKDQGLYNKQIGIVTYDYNNSFMRRLDSVVLYVTEVKKNSSILTPLNEDIVLSKINNLSIQFVE